VINLSGKKKKIREEVKEIEWVGEAANSINLEGGGGGEGLSATDPKEKAMENTEKKKTNGHYNSQ